LVESSWNLENAENQSKQIRERISPLPVTRCLIYASIQGILFLRRNIEGMMTEFSAHVKRMFLALE
jgi:hypothetical protein